MSTNTLPLDPKLTIIFQGFLVTRIRDGAAEATLGAIRSSACHQPRIRIKERAPNGAEAPILLDPNDLMPDNNFSLMVENTGVPGIRVYQLDDEPFNRLDDENDRKDFRWLLDIEALQGRPVTRDETKLFPVFTLNNGLFHTFTRSPGEVRITRKGRPEKRFGRFALEAAANIYFDQPNTRAVFSKGDKALLTIEPPNQSTFVIVVDCNCHQDEDISDFPMVYEVVTGVDDQEKLDFVGDPERRGPNRNPEVFCGLIK